MPRAFITGITGQDGHHLAEFLHEKGYDVYGMVKGQNNPKATQLVEELPFVELVPGDLADLPSLVPALDVGPAGRGLQPGRDQLRRPELQQSELTANTTGLGVLRMLEAIRMVGGAQNNPIRFYQASSSEMFGKVRETPQTERTPFHPRSPYGCAKVFGHDITVNYRESLRAVRLLGHPLQPRGPPPGDRVRDPQGHQRRGPHQARPAAGARAGHARHQARLGLRRRLRPGDVGDVAAGRARRLHRRDGRDPLDRGVRASGPSPRSASRTGTRYVRQDQKFYRPAEVDLLIGDASKAP